MPTAAPSFPVTNDDDANALLVADPFALLMGMLLDQQVPMEWAFHAPFRLLQRLGADRFTPTAIAAADPDELKALFSAPPALHRFPGSMAARVQALCQLIVERYDGDTARLWTEARSGADLLARLRELPGFGEEKARIFVAVLGKRFDVRPRGWKAAAGPFADSQRRSVADISSRAEFEKVRAWKKAQKAKGLGKSD